jgi:hypothetical protein
LVLGILLWPAVAPNEIDSLPVSNYPMFAHPRPQVTRFYLAVLIDPDGVEHRLDPSAVGGTDQPMQAAMTLQRSISAHTADVLCDEVAGGLDEVGTVQIVSVLYDSVEWFRGNHDPVERDVHAECLAGPGS